MNDALLAYREWVILDRQSRVYKGARRKIGACSIWTVVVVRVSAFRLNIPDGDGPRREDGLSNTVKKTSRRCCDSVERLAALRSVSQPAPDSVLRGAWHLAIVGRNCDNALCRVARQPGRNNEVQIPACSSQCLVTTSQPVQFSHCIFA